MAAMVAFPGLPLPKPSPPGRRPRFIVLAAAVAISNSQTRERQRLKQLFHEARERCRTDPMDGVPFTLEDFHAALDQYAPDFPVGSKIKGTIFMTDASGAYVDVTAKTSAFLPVLEASIHKIKHVTEVGIYPGLQEEFIVVGENEEKNCLILSLRWIQRDLAWERCRQLQAEDVTIRSQVVGGNKGGTFVIVEGIKGFVPFSHIAKKSSLDEFLNKELLLKFVEVDEEQSKLVLSNRKAVASNQPQHRIGSVVIGTIQSIKPFGAFVDIGGGMSGLLHVSQISHERMSDISSLLEPGDTIKAMVLSHDRERDRLSLSTKRLEPTPGDMIHNPKLVFEKADEIGQAFRLRLAQVEAIAGNEMVRLQPESELGISSEGILGPLAREGLIM